MFAFLILNIYYIHKGCTEFFSQKKKYFSKRPETNRNRNAFKVKTSFALNQNNFSF